MIEQDELATVVSGQGLPESGGQEVPSQKSESRAAARQAIVLVHGMGEQIPMDTIKSFVLATWHEGKSSMTELSDSGADLWSKPDRRTGTLELRRITTRKTEPGGSFPKGVRNDFFELYWADLTTGSTWDQFVGWIKNLLLRPLSRVPRSVRAAWFLLWLLTLLFVAIGAMAVVPESIWNHYAPDWLRPIVLAAVAFGVTRLHRIVARTFGRVVRYTRAEPDNIAARAAVRDRGLKLLRELHQSGYVRVIVVAHSLGTILAYDLISYFWAEREKARTVSEGSPAFAALCEVENAAAALLTRDGEDEIKSYRKAQAALRRCLVERSTPANDTDATWLISDFITLGSPLTHAEFLLADSNEDLLNRQKERELPTAPPFREMVEPLTLARAMKVGGLPMAEEPEKTRLISYANAGTSQTWTIHHAAPFAAVRWTNIHDPSRLIYRGDLISGPLARIFGAAIEDIDLAKLDRPSKSFTHTLYWDLRQPKKRLDALRDAMNFLDE